MPGPNPLVIEFLDPPPLMHLLLGALFFLIKDHVIRSGKEARSHEEEDGAEDEMKQQKRVKDDTGSRTLGP